MKLRSLLILLVTFPTASLAQAPRVVADPVGDALVRRSDPGADGPLGRAVHKMPDLVEYRIGSWQPLDPEEDLYVGSWSVGGDFFRLDLVFDGLTNPPGSLGLVTPFDPYAYGENPVFGYVELDMDADVNTGGELHRSDLRFSGNAARYGGLPVGARYADRVALDETAFDGDIQTGPFVDRSGEEFHVSLFGWLIDEIEDNNAGDANDVILPGASFGEGDDWTVFGQLLHRAHGYEPFSFACCDGLPGSYEPEVQLRFRHDTTSNQTTISLVCPLNNAGAAAMEGEEVEPDDGDASNQSSVLEGLNDLVFGVENPLTSWLSDPDFAIIQHWGARNPAEFLDPQSWKVVALVGMSYSSQDPDGALLAWTDMLPNVRRHDFNADHRVDQRDALLFDQFLAASDGVAGIDADGLVNGQVRIVNFGPNFSLFDVNYDGLVGAADRPRNGGFHKATPRRTKPGGRFHTAKPSRP